MAAGEKPSPHEPGDKDGDGKDPMQRFMDKCKGEVADEDSIADPMAACEEFLQGALYRASKNEFLEGNRDNISSEF